MTPELAASWNSISRHSKSFALAARLLPRDVRASAAALYAWCRACDDAIDQSIAAEHGGIMAALERQLDSIYAGEGQSELHAAAFQHVVRDCGIPIEYPRDLLAGFRMDVEQHSYLTLDDLILYSFRVAGTVGLMMCHVLGATDSRALVHASHLGIAMQLTNVCRDVAEDWGRGRLYLPREVLGAAVFDFLMTRRDEPFPADISGAVAPALRSLLRLADRYYASGEQGFAYLGTRARLAVRTAGLVYAAIGDEIAHARYDVLGGRAVVSGRRKARLAIQAMAATMVDAVDRRRTSRRLTPASVGGGVLR